MDGVRITCIMVLSACFAWLATIATSGEKHTPVKAAVICTASGIVAMLLIFTFAVE